MIPDRKKLPYILEMMTTSGKVSERYATYEEAQRRMNGFPDDSILGIPFIYKELPDGSQRLVREDGKPLQWHRLDDDGTPISDEPLF